MTAPRFAIPCVGWGSNPPCHLVSGATARNLNADVRFVPAQATGNAGRSSVVSLGWTLVVGWWYAMIVIRISIVRFASSLSGCGTLTEF